MSAVICRACKNPGTQTQGQIRSRVYNESVVLGQIASLQAILHNPPPLFGGLLRAHMRLRVPRWLDFLEALVSKVCVCVCVRVCVIQLWYSYCGA